MFTKLLNSFFFPLTYIRNFLYDKGFIKQVISSLPIISVGNLSFGGTGKTTFTIHICNKLMQNQIQPMVLSRGYKRKSNEIIIYYKNSMQPSVDIFGDEMFLADQKLQIPIAISKRKFLAIDKIENQINVDVIIIDDGFQHRKIFRDLDIVLIDKKSFQGFLREPLKNIVRAHIVLLQKCLDINLLPKGNFKVFKYNKIVKKFYDIDLNPVEPEQIANEKVLLVSGIGNNNSFLESMRAYFTNIVEHLKFKDHYYYTFYDVQIIIKNAKKLESNIVVTTEKDFVKLLQFKDIFKNNINLVVCEIDLDIENEDMLLDKILQTINQRRKK
ncbi:MAG: tetraacyldisaccharide 4'-kinase [Candidatus Kapaibacteriota bacterium]|jgi:tetraacyldisaccharide 4'-kinase